MSANPLSLASSRQGAAPHMVCKVVKRPIAAPDPRADSFLKESADPHPMVFDDDRWILFTVSIFF
jgi:hypothetical protein